MSSITLKTINLSSAKSDSKQVNVPVQLDLSSPKSVAYVVRWQLAKRRSGSAKTKTMAEISGTTAKPYKQKGTGRARQGSKRSVQFVGGRTCHGPMPRSFDFSMPKKIVRGALSDAIKTKLNEGKLVLFSDFGAEIKTSKISNALNQNSINSALIVFDSNIQDGKVLAKSVNNLKNVKAIDVKAINVYDILSFDNLLVDSKIFENNILGALQ